MSKIQSGLLAVLRLWRVSSHAVPGRWFNEAWHQCELLAACSNAAMQKASPNCHIFDSFAIGSELSQLPCKFQPESVQSIAEHYLGCQEQDVGHQSLAELSLLSFHRVRRLGPGGLPPFVP